MSGNRGNGPESSEVADLSNEPLYVFGEELDLLHSFLKDCCTIQCCPAWHVVYVSIKDLFLTCTFHCGKGVYEMQNFAELSDPCVWCSEGPQTQARDGL